MLRISERPAVHVLIVAKDSGERYVFMFDAAHREATLRTLGRYASDKELSFTWSDAAVLAQRIKHLPLHGELTP